jgi:hypothetical protein
LNLIFEPQLSSPPRESPSTFSPKGSLLKKVGTTRRLLSFFWQESAAGKPGCDDEWMTEILVQIEFASVAAQSLGVRFFCSGIASRSFSGTSSPSDSIV